VSIKIEFSLGFLPFSWIKLYELLPIEVYSKLLSNLFVFFSLFQEQKIDQEFELLVLASDGLWDVVPNEVIMLTLSLSLSLTHTHTHTDT